MKTFSQMLSIIRRSKLSERGKSMLSRIEAGEVCTATRQLSWDSAIGYSVREYQYGFTVEKTTHWFAGEEGKRLFLLFAQTTRPHPEAPEHNQVQWQLTSTALQEGWAVTDPNWNWDSEKNRWIRSPI